tara:strand:- start:250 stop:555 length:306 start_codon:yes stop_codon:yes gene_type:complete
MSLNIIVKGGKRSGMSGEEMAHYLSKKVERDAEREKAGYKGRAIAARKNAEKLSGGKDFRLVSAIDTTTFLRHEIQNKGCMSDSEYRRDFAKSNPETVLGS